MAEIPGILRPELQALPQIADHMTFLLFPAHAGVIPSRTAASITHRPILRTRGGDPEVSVDISASEIYSPHTRG